MKILIVEDYAKLAEFLRGSFADIGHDVTWVSSIADAIKAHESMMFDGTVCDGTLDPNNRGDGIRYAQSLMKQGQRVVLFSTLSAEDVPAGIPFVMKGSMGFLTALFHELSAQKQAKNGI